MSTLSSTIYHVIASIESNHFHFKKIRYYREKRIDNSVNYPKIPSKFSCKLNLISINHHKIRVFLFRFVLSRWDRMDAQRSKRAETPLLHSEQLEQVRGGGGRAEEGEIDAENEGSGEEEEG